MDFKKRANESVKEYKYRMYKNKDIYGLRNDEIGEIINKETGESFDESAHRKWATPYIDGFDTGYEKGFNDGQSGDVHELSAELDEKRIKLKEEQTKLSTLRLDLNKTIRNTSRFEQWVDEVKREIKNVKVDVPKYKGMQRDVNIDKEYLLTIADIHTGRKGESLDNYYDLDTLQDRMWQVRDEAVELIKEKSIKTLRVLCLGDLIDGLLRASQIQNLQISRANQTVFIARFLFEWLNSMTECCYIDFKMVTSSNHSESRPLNSQRGEFKDDDYEIIIYEWLSDLCDKNPKISIEGNSILEFDILGRKCIAMHGHQLPRGNKQNLLANVSFHMNQQYQYLFQAHLHHTEIMTVGKNELGNKEVIYCPCICGNDEYSDSLWTGASAGSLFLEFDSKQGRRSITDFILK